MLKDVHDQLLKDKNVEMEVTPVAKILLADKGYDPTSAPGLSAGSSRTR